MVKINFYLYAIIKSFIWK